MSRRRFNIASRSIQDSRWPRVSLFTSECLELFRRYDASWKNMEWCKHSTVFYLQGPAWEFYGNIWAHSGGSYAIDFVQLPSRLRGIPIRQWALRFDFAARDSWTHLMTYWRRSRTTLESTSTSCPLFLNLT